MIVLDPLDALTFPITQLHSAYTYRINPNYFFFNIKGIQDENFIIDDLFDSYNVSSIVLQLQV